MPRCPPFQRDLPAGALPGRPCADRVALTEIARYGAEEARGSYPASLRAHIKTAGSTTLVCGQTSRPAAARPEGAASGEAFGLPPGGLALILGIPASEFTDRVFELEAVDRAWASRAPDAGLLGRLCAERARERGPAYGVFRSILDDPEKYRLRRVGEIARLVGYCERQLRRIFLEYSGFATKEFFEILNFSIAVGSYRVGTMGRDRGRDDRPYFDQSHMARHFKRFGGAAPGAFGKMSGIS